MSDLAWNGDGTVSIDPPKRPKKITGTRFAAILGANRWSTPFQNWCEITKAYAPPFEDTQYTLAGKAIEPKQIAYMRSAYGMDDLVDPTEVWGADPFKRTYGNFFAHPVLGGMWDALLVDRDGWDGSPRGLEGRTEAVLEFKTTKRAEDWADGAVPEYYALQAALYAWLLGCDDVIMVVSFLQEADYADPSAFEPSAANTATREFKVSERYPGFGDTHVRPALEWWRDHVETGRSPAYDERADAEYLKALRTAHPEDAGSELGALLAELADKQALVEAATAAVAPYEKRIAQIKAILKQHAMDTIGGADRCEFGDGNLACVLVRTVGRKADEEALKRDGLWERYSSESESVRFTVGKVKKG